MTHGGDLALAALAQFGVRELFTLNGAHVWPFYDAARKAGVPVYDTRHEQSATFAAEAVAKLTRRPGVAVLTAGPGVTNGVSAVTGAHFLGSPLVVLGGRAPEGRWGSGSLQEFDHVPLMAPITKLATTVKQSAQMGSAVVEAVATALTPHRGPVFLDFPMDALFAETADQAVPDLPDLDGEVPDPDEVLAAAKLLATAEHPAMIVGSDVFWAGAWELVQDVAEAHRIPVFVNGLGRGCVPADHELAFSRTRGMLKTDADLVMVVGAPLDFRLSFGRFGGARVVHLVDDRDQRAGHAEVALSVAGDLNLALRQIAEWSGHRADHEPWIEKLRDAERASRAKDEPLLTAESGPIKPPRVYGELKRVLDRDAVVVCDGGDFVSYAGKYVDSYEPGCWLDPGPYGCLGTGMGYAMGARVACPGRQVVVMLGDGAAGFSLMDIDSLVRQDLPVVIVCGNNGIWGLEKHPMQAVYGYDMNCDLQPECRYDEVVGVLGGAGETVREPNELGPALDRAFSSGVPYLLNVICDPDDVYPRSSNLA